MGVYSDFFETVIHLGNIKKIKFFLLRSSYIFILFINVGTSLVVQWLGFCTPNAGGPGFNPWSGNYIPHAATKSLNAANEKIHIRMKIEDPVCHS